MVVVDRPVVFGGDRLDDGTAVGSVGWSNERREPAVGESSDAFEFRWGDAAQPHVHPLRCGQDGDALVVEVVAVVIERLAGPAFLHHGEGFVEDLGALGSLDPERLLFDRVDGAQPERGQQSTTRHQAECGEFLGEHDRVAAGEHHDRHAELELRRSTGSVCHRHERVGRLAADLLRQPERVEAVSLERVDHDAVGLVVEVGARAEPEPDANLHVGRVRHAGGVGRVIHERAIRSRRSATSVTALMKGEWSVSMSICSVHRAAMTVW